MQDIVLYAILFIRLSTIRMMIPDQEGRPFVNIEHFVWSSDSFFREYTFNDLLRI